MKKFVVTYRLRILVEAEDDLDAESKAGMIDFADMDSSLESVVETDEYE
jgi:hypothetical protein